MSRTIKGVFWLLVSNGATKLLWTASVVLLMRVLGPSSYGALATVWAFSGLIAGMSDLGAGQAMIREGSRQEHQLRPYLLSAVLLKGVLLVPVWIAITAIGLFWLTSTPAGVPGWTFAVALAAATPLIDHFQALWSQAMQVLHRLDVFSVWRTIYFVAIFVGFWAASHGEPVLTVSIVYFCITVLFAALLGWRVLWLLPKPSMDTPRLYPLRQAVTEGAPFLLTMLLALAYYRVDMMLLGLLGSNEEAGIYSAQYQIIILLYSISAIIFSVVFPDLYRHSHDDSYMQRRFERIARYLNLLAWVATPCLFVYAQDIMTAMGGEAFAVRYEGLRILSFMVPLYLSAIALNFLTAFDRLKTRIYCELTALVVTVVGGILVIPLFSLAGMAFVADVAYAVSGAAALTVLVRRHRIDLRPVFRDLIRMGIAVIPAMAIFTVPFSRWWLGGLAFIALAVLSLTLFRFWDIHDRTLMREAWRLLRVPR